MTATALSPARVLRRPHRLDRRAVVGVFLLLVATGGSLAFWSASSATTAVLVATHDLPAGATLSAGNLEAAHVRLDGSIYQAAVPASELDTVVGSQLSSPVYAHQLLVRAQISSSLPIARDQIVFTIPVTADTAAGGHIQPGNVVEVLVTTGKGTSAARSTVVLPRVSVYDVGHDGGAMAINATGSTAAQGSISWLTLIVTQRQALQLAQAKWAGVLDVALRPGR